MRALPNAVILADRFTDSLLPLVYESHEGLVRVCGQSLVERQIRQLLAAGISDITVVCGYRGEELGRVASELGAGVEYNRDYGKSSLVDSLHLIRGRLGRTFVLCSDVWASGKAIPREGERSWAVADCGIVFLSERDTPRILCEIESECAAPERPKSTWENLFCRSGLALESINDPSIRRIRSLADLAALDPSGIGAIHSPILRSLSEIFQAGPLEFKNFVHNDVGLSNFSCRFDLRGQSYFLRCPGQLSGDAAMRRQEQEAYSAMEARGLGISDEVVYLNPVSGLKISKFIRDAYYPDPTNEGHVRRCLDLIRKLHRSGIKTRCRFDLLENFRVNEEGTRCAPEDYLEDYSWAREAFLQILSRLPEEPDPVFCHTDPIRYNFLFTRDRDYMIDFEYAGMGSPMIDLAAFTIYCDFDGDQIDRMLELYYGRKAQASERRLLDCYIALTGMISALWYLDRVSIGYALESPMQRTYTRYAIAYLRELCA